MIIFSLFFLFKTNRSIRKIYQMIDEHQFIFNATFVLV